MTILNSGVPVVIEWHKFAVGGSFYIPTLTPDTLAEDIRRAAKERGMVVKHRLSKEGNTYGVRFWRIK
jgi:hypothetical protein